MIVAGSFHGTRTSGVVSVCETACSMETRSLMPVVPCCRSMHSASKPWRAITSAEKLLAMEIQPSVTGLPALHICLILFGRIEIPFTCEWTAAVRRGRNGAALQTENITPCLPGRWDESCGGGRRRPERIVLLFCQTL